MFHFSWRSPISVTARTPKAARNTKSKETVSSTAMALGTFFTLRKFRIGKLTVAKKKAMRTGRKND